MIKKKNYFSKTIPSRRSPIIISLLKVFAIASVASFFSVACVEDFDPAGLLGDHIRVLSIRCDPPQAHPGDDVSVESLIYVPENSPGRLDTLWLVCVPSVGESAQQCLTGVLSDVFGIAGGCDAICASDPDPETCVELCMFEFFLDFSCDPSVQQKGCILGQGIEQTYSVHEDIRGSLQTEDSKKIFVFLMSTVLAGGLSRCFEIFGEQAAQTGGISPTEDCIMSLKELNVLDENKEISSNPTVNELLLNGMVLVAPPSVTIVELEEPEPKNNELTLSVLFTMEEGAQGYISWFSNCGKLKSVKTFGDKNENVLKPAGTGLCEVYAVVRDNAGGQNWIHRRIDLQSLN